MAADGSIIIETLLDDKDAQKELTRLNNRIKTLNNQIYTNQRMKMPLVEQSKQAAANLDLAKAALEKMKAASAGTYTADQIAQQDETVKSLQKHWEGIQSRVEAYDRSIRTANEKLNIAKEQAGEIQQRMAAAGVDAEKMAKATAKAKKHTQGFATQLKYAMSSIILYGGLFQIFSGLTQWLGKVIKVNDEASAAVARLKGALLTLAQPLLNVIIPAFSTFVNLLASMVSVISSFLSALFGNTQEQAASQAEDLYNQAEALEAAGNAAKKAGKSLASFDEINKLSSGASETGKASDSIKPNFDTGFVSGPIKEIASIVGGALLAIGALLTFSGANVPLGLGLIATGALLLAKPLSENWTYIQTMMQGPLGFLSALLGSALLVLGAIMTFSGGNIPLGLGMMAVGAAALAMPLAVNWETIISALQGPIGAVVALLSTSLLVIGAILAFSGAALPLGIGLMVVGAVGLATTIAANWDYIVAALQGPIGIITAILSSALLVLGGVLAFSGANVPLGIALMVAGAAGLATSIAANWETIQNLLQGPVGVITAIISSALLVLGAILTFSGAALPLGLGLMVAGAVGLASSIAANWDAIVSSVGEEITAITAIVSAALLVLGIILIFTGAAAPLGLGLLLAGAAGLAVAVAPNWDFILDALKGAWDSVVSWWNTYVAKYFTIEYWIEVGKGIVNGLISGIKSLWSGVTGFFGSIFGGGESTLSARISSESIPASMPAMSISSIPKLARGAVIPPNREFLAVLGDQKQGTNVEAPLSTFEQAVANVMSRMGYGAEQTVILQVDKDQLGKVVYKLNKAESRRIGVNLAGV